MNEIFIHQMIQACLDRKFEEDNLFL